MYPLLNKLGLRLPIVQAPMAGTSTPVLAAAVSNAGGLGSLGVANVDADTARDLIAATRTLTDAPFNVNVFCHRPAIARPEVEAAWLARLAPTFARFGASPPARLRNIYLSFLEDEAMLAMLLEERPAVVSFHFGLPAPAAIAALHDAGITLFATATNLDEARAIADAGIDAIVAQGYEAGGHRGIFDPHGPDPRLGTFALTRLIANTFPIPVIATGGIMDGRGIAAALSLGASAAQLGTAFIDCPESSADPAHRAALHGPAAHHTTITTAISGRPARCLPNQFTALGETLADTPMPDYPIVYDAGKALNATAKAAGETGFGPHWAGQAAPLARTLPAADLMATLADEWTSAAQNVPTATIPPPS